MQLKDLLDLLDPMTQLRIVCYGETEYYSRPLDFWENPDAYEKDLIREVIKLDPETLNGDPVLMVGLETETHLKDRERTDKMFRPADWVKRCPDFHADKDGNMVPDWETD